MTQNLQAVSVPNEVVSLAENAIEMAEALTIDSSDMAEVAGDDLKQLARMKKKVEESRFSITRPLDAAKKAAMEAYRPMVTKIEKADSIIRGKLNTYLQEQRVAQRRAEEQAAAKAAAERAEIEARAAEAAKNGDAEAAQAAEDDLLLADINAPVVAAPAKIGGISTAKTWKVDSIDLLELVQAAAEDPDLLQYLSANTVEINKVVRALGQRHRIPGVKAIEDESLRVRS